jgi:flagellar motor switch protein FliN/FliY
MSNEFLTQDEIDALLRGETTDQQFASDQGSTGSELTEIERDTLAEIGNISMGSAATALSTLINRKVTITVPDVSVDTFHGVQERYPIPCIIVNVEYKAGFQGANLLVIRERDASVIGNLMMGEDGTNIPEHIDELSLSAVTEAMNVMMGSAATSMSDLFHYMIDISPPDTTKRNLAEDQDDLVVPEAVYAVISFRLEIPDLVDSTMLQIIDLDFAKSMVSQLLATGESAAAIELPVRDTEPLQTVSTPNEQQNVPNQWTDLAQPQTPEHGPGHSLGNLNVELIKDIPVQVRAVLGRNRMSIENILKLGPGHIMELDTIEGEPIDVYANDTLIARGEVVVVDDQFGIRITEISTPRNRINSIR